MPHKAGKTPLKNHKAQTPAQDGHLRAQGEGSSLLGTGHSSLLTVTHPEPGSSVSLRKWFCLTSVTIFPAYLKPFFLQRPPGAAPRPALLHKPLQKRGLCEAGPRSRPPTGCPPLRRCLLFSGPQCALWRPMGLCLSDTLCSRPLQKPSVRPRVACSISYNPTSSTFPRRQSLTTKRTMPCLPPAPLAVGFVALFTVRSTLPPDSSDQG